MRFGLMAHVLSGMLIISAAAATAAPITMSLAAEPLYTTAALQSLCNSIYDIDVGLCGGYLMGIADALQQQGQACLTTKIGPDTLTDNMRRAWAQQPSQPVNAAQSVQDIIRNRFPCR